LLIDDGLIEGRVSDEIGGKYPRHYVIQRLTSAGHDFLDASRNDTIWAKFKKRAAKFGGSLSIPVAMELLKTLLKDQLKL